MSTVFERIVNRFFGKPTSSNIQSSKKRKSVRIQEEHNEVYLIASVDDFLQGKKKENSLHKKLVKIGLRSVEKKPFVPPVGTILQAISKKKQFVCAVVVLPDHRLMEVQRGSATGIHLHPRFIFNSPYEWQCWLNKF